MIKTETATVELHPNVDRSAWRRFWLSHVMIERGKSLPAKVPLKIRATQRTLAWRLNELRRLESAARVHWSKLGD